MSFYKTEDKVTFTKTDENNNSKQDNEKIKEFGSTTKTIKEIFIV